MQRMTAMKEMFYRYLFASRLPKAEARRRLLAVSYRTSTASTRFFGAEFGYRCLGILGILCILASTHPNLCAR